jgi:hypothetical protein
MRLFFRRNLGRVVKAVLASSLPASACGTGATIDVDAGDAASNADVRDVHKEGPCNCFDCPIPDKIANATYTQCPDDAGDAQADGDAAPSCFVDCNAPCDMAFGDAASACQGNWLSPSSPIACECIPQTDVDDAGNVTVQCIIGFVCGRRSEGLVEAAIDESSTLGATFARCAWLEAASIGSFRTLARELTEHGAPRRLVRAARVAARQEARHASLMGQLARAHGARIPRVERSEPAARSLEELARENAIEGCVGETFGALVAAWQAERAFDPEASAVFRAIANDELDHATLAWRVAAWAERRLDGAARARVSKARRAAVRRLSSSVHHDPPAEIVRAAGVPNAAEARALVQALFAISA